MDQIGKQARKKFFLSPESVKLYCYGISFTSELKYLSVFVECVTRGCLSFRFLGRRLIEKHVLDDFTMRNSVLRKPRNFPFVPLTCVATSTPFAKHTMLDFLNL